MNHPQNEKLMIEAARYVDGELSAELRSAFEARLPRDHALAQAVSETRELRLLFAPSRDPVPPVLSPGFRTRLLQEVRSLPSRDDLLAELGEEGELEQAQGASSETARRLLLAAALIFGLALLMFSGLLRGADTARLEATPDLLRRLDKLDVQIKTNLQTAPALQGNGAERGK